MKPTLLFFHELSPEFLSHETRFTPRCHVLKHAPFYQNFPFASRNYGGKITPLKFEPFYLLHFTHSAVLCFVPFTVCRLPLTDYSSLVADYRLQVIPYRFLFRCPNPCYIPDGKQ